MPQHSIIMPVYNGERYLQAAIASVLGQQGAELELIVVDDCSSDGSAHIAAQCGRRDARLRLARTALNSGGPAGPKNLGLALARGRFISFCDQDDLLLPHKLARASAVFARHPELDVLFFDFQPCDADGAPGPAYLAGKGFLGRAATYLSPFEDELHLCRRFLGCMAGIDSGMSTQGIVCRREVLEGQRFDTRFRIVDDIAMWYRLAEQARIAFVAESAALYRQHAAALTGDSVLLTRETVAFHRENYFRQRHLLDAAENRRYRRMLGCFFVRAAALPGIGALEQRNYLLQALGFDVRLSTLRWLLQTVL